MTCRCVSTVGYAHCRCDVSARGRWLFVGLLVAAFVLLPLAEAQAQDPTRLENEILAFEQADATTLHPANPILFVGSSSVRGWSTLAADLPDYLVLNRGFGGSLMSDVLYYFDRVVAVYEPAVIVVYEGDNDLAGGKSVDEVYADYLAFLSLVTEQLPGTEVAFIATKPSPSRAQFLDATRELNRRLEDLAAAAYHLWFIDVFTPMLGEDGQPRAELFLSDMLHMNSDGYALWQSVVEPVLEMWTAHKGQTFLFDFGAADGITLNGPVPDDPGNVWNNVTEEIGSVADGQLPALVNTQGAPTEMGLEILSPFSPGGPNRSGPTESVQFAQNATSDSLYGHTGSWGGATEVYPSFKLTGLEPSMTYDFTFYASRTSVGDNRETGYRVTGAGSGFVALNPANNVDDSVTIAGIEPDALGEITIGIAPTANNNNGNHFTYLGVMKMQPQLGN